jgi:hypothetical protein
MTLPIDHVRPGDVITAAFMNALIDQLQGLDGRLSKVEGGLGTGPVITDVIPSTPVHVGDDIEIRGSHFDFSVGAQRVYFDATRVTVFRAGSTDSRLLVQVPNVPNPSASGSPVTLLVTNLTGSTSRQITVLPVTQQGNVFITFLGVTPATITPGQTTSAVFSYRADCQTLSSTIITITPTVNVSNWQSLLQVLGNDGQVLPDGRLALTPGQQAQFSINLPSMPPPAGTPPSVQISVALTGPGIQGTTDTRTITFGTQTAPPDPSIQLSFNSAFPQGAVQGSVIHVSAANPTATVALRAVFTVDGVYDLTAPLSGVTGWTVTPSQNPLFPTSSPITITGSSSGTPQTRFPAWDVAAPGGAGASPSGQVSFSVQRRGTPSGQSANFSLQRDA